MDRGRRRCGAAGSGWAFRLDSADPAGADALATFFPLGVSPRRLQVFVECTPLYQGIEIVRGLALGAVTAALLGRAVASCGLGRLLP